MRTSRIRTTALATVTAALALGLTACGSGGGDNGSKAASSSHDAATAQSRLASTGHDSDSGSKEGLRPQSASGGTDAAASKNSTAGGEQCRGDEMLVSAVHRFAGQQGDHLLVTAVNKG
ncbi:hypothetical protein AB0I22_31630, partial [Streptomyces sp. NPDC050610]